MTLCVAHTSHSAHLSVLMLPKCLETVSTTPPGSRHSSEQYSLPSHLLFAIYHNAAWLDCTKALN